MIQKIKNSISKKVLTIIGSISVVIAVITGIFAIDDRYAKGEDLKKLEQDSIKTFKDFQVLQQKQIKAVKQSQQIQYLQLKYEWTESKLSSIRQQLTKSEFKDNSLLLNEYESLTKKRDEIKNKLDDLLME